MTRNLLFLGTSLLLYSCDIPLEQFYAGKLDENGSYDLEASTLVYSPKIVNIGDPVIFDYKISNTGRDDVPHGTYDVDLYLNGDSIAFDHGTSTISQGSHTEYSMSSGFFHWKPDKKGIYQIELKVDEHDTLPETDETNNNLNITIEIK